MINTSLISLDSGRDDVDELRIPANDLAVKLGKVRTAIIEGLDAFVDHTRLMDMQTLRTCAQSAFFKKAAMVPLNLAALEQGQKGVIAPV